MFLVKQKVLLLLLLANKSIQFIQTIPSDPISVQYQPSSSKGYSSNCSWSIIITPPSKMRWRGAAQHMWSAVDRYLGTDAPWQGSPLLALVMQRLTAPPLLCTLLLPTSIMIGLCYYYTCHTHGRTFISLPKHSWNCLKNCIMEWSPFLWEKRTERDAFAENNKK
jgi:hypothetical protein